MDDAVPHRELPRFLAALPAIASTVAMSVGALVLVGWACDLQTLTRVVPGFVAMNPASATCFILAGAALALSREDRERMLLAKILSGIIAAVGTAKLIGVAAAFHPNIDELLFPSKLPMDSVPNRMAPNTALTFLLLGIALLALDLKAKRFSLSQFFAIAGGFSALLSVTGYLYGVKAFYGVASFIPMALHTAITFLLLAVGIFFARANTPLAQLFATDDPRGVLARRLVPLAVFTTIALGWLRLKGEQFGWYPTEFGTALLAIALTVVLVALGCWTIASVGKVEAERSAINRQLLETNAALDEALRQSELIINHARELICTLDRSAKLLSINAASEELLGQTATRLIGHSFYEILDGEARGLAQAAIRNVQAGSANAEFTADCLRRDGSTVSIAWSICYSKHYGQVYCVGRQSTYAAQDQSHWSGSR